MCHKYGPHYEYLMVQHWEGKGFLTAYLLVFLQIYKCRYTHAF